MEPTIEEEQHISDSLKLLEKEMTIVKDRLEDNERRWKKIFVQFEMQGEKKVQGKRFSMLDYFFWPFLDFFQASADRRDEHQVVIPKLEKELAKMEITAKERENAMLELKKAHENELSNSERIFEYRINELVAKIDETARSAERCEIQTDAFKKKLYENIARNDALEKRLGEARKNERDKDMQIQQLQKEMNTQREELEAMDNLKTKIYDQSETIKAYKAEFGHYPRRRRD